MANDPHYIGKNPSGLKRLPRAIMCSLKGYKAAWVYESGFRQYATLSLLLVPFSFFIAQSSLHWVILIASLVFLLFSEIVNSAIEAVADAAKPEYNEFIGRGKDLGSAAVFTALLLSILVWGIALYEYTQTWLAG
jgi:diacylglycerol kinase (ATP)